MVRVAHFTDAAVGGANGIASSIRLLVEALTGVGHDCAVVSGGPLWGAARGGAGAIRVPSMPTGMGDFRWSFFPIRTMRERVRDWRPDIAHVHSPGPLGLAGLALARRLGIPAVYTYHTDLHGYAQHYYVPTPVLRAGIAVYTRHLRCVTATRPAGKYEVIEAGNARLFDAADVIIAPTASALSRCRMAAFADKVRVVPTPALLPAAGTTGTEFRARVGVAAGAPVVMYLGRVSAEKGIRLLLDAFAVVRDRVPAARLLLVGPHCRRLGLRRLLHQTGLAAHTVVTGTLRGADVTAAYRAGSVFAFPSLTDTQGIVLHEAALAGLPIVMTDGRLHGSHPLAGAMRLTDPAPAAFAAGIAELLRAPHDARRLGQRGRELARAHTPDRFADQTLRAYHDALTLSMIRASR
ncbi:glycosyltransferase [Actinomycetes bacterium KLBMP 9797]